MNCKKFIEAVDLKNFKYLKKNHIKIINVEKIKTKNLYEYLELKCKNQQGDIFSLVIGTEYENKLKEV